MRLLLTLLFFGMAVAHIVDFGLVRYAPVIGLTVLIILLGKHVFLPPNRWWYHIGCWLYIGSAAAASIQYGNSLSYAYLVMGVLNYLLYPAFERVRLTNLHLAIILIGLLVSIVPLGIGRRVASIYGNPNNYSAVVFATMYFGMLLFRGRLLYELMVWALFAGLIFLGASRSMLGAVIFFAMLYFGQRYVVKFMLNWTFVLAFAAAGFGYYSLITSDEFRIMEVIQANTYSDKKGRGLSHRDELFAQSVLLVQDRPHGYGLGMSKAALKRRFGLYISPHNTYLKVAVEGGVVALAGFLILVAGFWVTSTSPLASSFLFCLMIRGFFESATPLSISLISGMLVIPMFLNEHTVDRGYRLNIFPPLREKRPPHAP